MYSQIYRRFFGLNQNNISHCWSIVCGGRERERERWNL